MIRREKIHALILSRKNVGEADRALTLFTRQHGLLRVIAKGVRKIPSRRGGHLEPLTHVLAIISGNPGRFFLAAVEPQTTHSQLRDNPHALSFAQSLAQLLHSLATEEEAHPTLFDAVHHAWRMLPALPTPKQRLLSVAVILHALHRFGWLPNLQACQRCGTTLPRDAVIFSGQHGAWRCLGCHGSLAGTRTSLAPRLLKALRFLNTHPQKALQLQVTDEESGQLLATMQDYCDQVISNIHSSVPSSYAR